jgi:hypothetical protein
MNDFILLKDAKVVLGILFSCVIHQPFYFTRIIHVFFLSYLFWWVSIKKLFRYVGTLWFQDRGSLFRAP